MPRRIQMHRRKGGWRAEHPSAVVVARPGPFGNPFSVAEEDGPGYTRRGAVTAFEDWLAGNPWACGADTFEARRQVLLSRLEELRGRDLACWCRPDQECHADVLLRLANRDKMEGQG